MGNALLIALVVLAAVVTLAATFQRRLIYLPYPRQLLDRAVHLPAAREVEIATADRLVLSGWYIPAEGGAWGAVVVFNGNAGNRSHRAPLAGALAARGLDVLLFDYRGYADNPGRPSEAGLLADARAARGVLLALSGIDPSRLVYFGESLGTGVAVALAAEAPPGALVLRSPFPSLAEVGRRHYPFLPVRLMLRDRWDSGRRIAAVHSPLLVIAGTADRIVPIELSRRLFDLASEPKRWLEIADADHNDWELLAGDLLVDEVVGFLEGHLREGGSR